MSYHEPKSVSTNGVMRVFIESDDAASAREVASILCNRLAVSLNWEIRSVENYRKIPEWFEVVVGFSDMTSIEETLARVQELGTRWGIRIHEREATAMWASEIGGTFVHPQVRWANIECFEGS